MVEQAGLSNVSQTTPHSVDTSTTEFDTYLQTATTDDADGALDAGGQTTGADVTPQTSTAVAAGGTTTLELPSQSPKLLARVSTPSFDLIHHLSEVVARGRLHRREGL